MAIGKETTGCKVGIEGHDVENMNDVVYLGVKFSEEGRMEGELREELGLHRAQLKQ